MKAHLDIAHSGTLGSDDRTRMTFDENSIAHLMSVLTDLYSDPAMAVIREYSTNARDAHRSIGNTAPIEVATPTMLAPTFVVRDFGPGLSITQITDNFSKYGWSSKRDSDDEVGMLGLGCKSALSYTSQFTLVSRHNGLKITVLVTRDPDGCGVVQIIDTTPTDEPSGVEVQIPSKNTYALVIKAEWFYGFWEPGTVLIDGAPPKKNWRDVGRDGVALDDDVVAIRHKEIECDYLVMGDVPYPIKHKVLENAHDTHVIAWVPIGAIDFTPSREQLHYTRRTEATIAEVKEFVQERGNATSQRQLDACPTRAEAAYLAVHLGGLWGRRGRPTYRGEVIPNHLGTQDGGFRLKVKMSHYDRDQSYKGVGVMSLTSWLEASLIVTNYKPTSMQPGVKDRAREYCASLGIKDGTIYFLDGPASDWLESVPMIDYADLRQFGTKPVVKRTPTAPKSHYRIMLHDGTVQTTPDRPDDIIAWVAGDVIPSQRARYHSLTKDGGCIAVVNKSAMAAWEADEADVPHVSELARIKAQEAYDNVTEWEWWQASDLAYQLRTEPLTIIRPDAWFDPDLRELGAKAREKSKGGRHALQLAVGLVQISEPLFEMKPPSSSHMLSKVKVILQRYPLMGHMSGYGSREAARYCVDPFNAQYIVRQQLNLIPIQ